jgi:hypothetical protein
MVNEKCRQRISPWGNVSSVRSASISVSNALLTSSTDTITQDAAKFSDFFHKVTDLLLAESDEIDLNDRRVLLLFVINSYRSFENPVVRKECMR